jgi:hypothetical protein
MTRYREDSEFSRVVGPHGLNEHRASWHGEGLGEPRLDELLDDPIMTLLWQGDRLEPRSARETVLSLREVVHRRDDDHLSLTSVAA